LHDSSQSVELAGALQLTLRPPPTDPTAPLFAGKTYVRSQYDNPDGHASYGELVLGDSVAHMFATRFAADNLKGVPVMRYDLTGFGASLFSEWNNWQWGQIFSHALRQPRLGQTLGLIYQDVRVPVAPEQLADGGWLWFEIDTKSPANWYSKLVTNDPKPVRLYAARLPPIIAPQPMFAALLFPTYPTKPKDNSHVLDEAQFAADAYLDGFAKIVHAHQPDSADASCKPPKILPARVGPTSFRSACLAIVSTCAGCRATPATRRMRIHGCLSCG
jgi:hypothetical protein